MSEPISLETESERDGDAEEAHEDEDTDAGEEEAADDELAPPEPEQPVAEAGVTPEEWEDRWKKADRAFDTYAKRIGVIFEEDAQRFQPFSLSPSAPMGFLNPDDAGRVPDETREAALMFLGFAREQEYEADPETQECATCRGKGKTKTGSHVAGRETRACPRCNGSGATGLSVAGTAPATNGATEAAFSLAEPASALAPDADNWAQPRILPDGRENPNYGRMPQYWVQVEPWGDTRGLGAQDAAA